jgi:hypothetical protein
MCRIQSDVYSGPQGVGATSFKPPASPNPPVQLCPPLPIDPTTQSSVADYPEGTHEVYLPTIYEEHNPSAATSKRKNPDDEFGRWTNQSSTHPVLSVAAARMVDSKEPVPHPCNPSYRDYSSHPDRFGNHALGAGYLPWVPMGCHQLGRSQVVYKGFETRTPYYGANLELINSFLTRAVSASSGLLRLVRSIDTDSPDMLGPDPIGVAGTGPFGLW